MRNSGRGQMANGFKAPTKSEKTSNGITPPRLLTGETASQHVSTTDGWGGHPSCTSNEAPAVNSVVIKRLVGTRSIARSCLGPGGRVDGRSYQTCEERPPLPSPSWASEFHGCLDVLVPGLELEEDWRCTRATLKQRARPYGPSMRHSTRKSVADVGSCLRYG